MVGDGVTVRERGGKEGETVAELTAVAVGVEAGSWTHWRWRGGDGDPRRPAMKKTTVSAMGRVPGHLARRG